ncbi:unnamed protein product [Prorocentrum cordatum]|uniref:Myb/SANT-like domain-containing protein n=1 Tax=Prorocentrum cordatum TaxID=2364126 RepID=A0ABN9YEU0_9DINO|nr:unnamed protein product [Polarella glacialis]
MAPKKAKKVDLSPRAKPVVSEADLQQAKTALQDEGERKRARSSLKYWLEEKGQHNSFKSVTTAEKKEFLEAHWATKLKERAGKYARTSTKEHTFADKEAHLFQWMGKFQMQQVLGEQKAQNKTDSGKLITRPDPDTGKEDEWSIEYRVYQDGGGNEEHRMRGEKPENSKDDLDETAAKEADDFMQEMSSHMGSGSGSASSGEPLVNVKIEKTGGDAPAEPPNPHKTTFDKIKANIKSEIRKTKTGKYVQSLNDDVSKMIPKMSKAIKTMERVFLQKGDDDIDDAMILAVAKQVDEASLNYDAVIDWARRLITDKKRKK